MKHYSILIALVCFSFITIGIVLAKRLNIPFSAIIEQHTVELDSKNGSNLFKRFNLPEGFERMQYNNLSFENWLRYSTLKNYNSPVFLFNGALKPNQNIHAAVLQFDVGKVDLQQCADAVIRLRAEYLYQKKAFDSIVFTFTNGTKAPYSKWRAGYRTEVSGNTVKWVKKAGVDTSYACFRKYLNTLFMYCGTYSLSNELKKKPIENIQAGDVFINGGFPGHAMIVMDVARNKTTGKKLFMLAQSYMPAQDIHIVKNLKNKGISPWFEIPMNGTLETPEWTFNTTDLKRF